MKIKAYLTGADLEQYEADLVAESELAAKRDAMLARSRRMAQPDADSSDSDEDSDGGSSDASAVGDVELPVEMDFEPSRLGTRRVAGGFAGGAGAWDEFLDAGSVDGGVAQSFDIYVRGKFAKRAVPGAGLERWRMFPVVERKRRVDAWGEAIDVEGWLRRGVEEEDEFTKSAREARERGEVGKRGREEEEKVEVRVFSLSGCAGLWSRGLTFRTLQDKVDPPHKYVVEQVEVHLRCSLFVVDMEGRTDGRAIKTILPQINPRKLVRSLLVPFTLGTLVADALDPAQVIVDGSPTAVADLESACRAVSTMTDEIFTPQVDQCITIGEESRNFSVRLGDSIMASLKLSRVRPLRIPFLRPAGY